MMPAFLRPLHDMIVTYMRVHARQCAGLGSEGLEYEYAAAHRENTQNLFTYVPAYLLGLFTYIISTQSRLVTMEGNN